MTSLVRLDEQKQELQKRIADWSEADLSFHPTPESWSVIEIFDHLVKTEVGISAIARRGFDNPHRIGIRDRLGVRFIYKVFLTDRQVKVPEAAKAVLPTPGLQLDAVLQRWDSSRLELHQLVDELGPTLPRGGVFRHPVGGWMTFSDVLDFFYAHMVHHAFQINRIELAIKQLPSFHDSLVSPAQRQTRS